MYVENLAWHPCDAALGIEFVGCPVGPRCRPQHTTSGSQIPTSSQIRRLFNNLKRFIDQAERGCARAYPNRVQATKGIARQNVFPSWVGWQDKRLSSSCIRCLCTGQDSIWIRSRAGCLLVNPKGEAREGSTELGKTRPSLAPYTCLAYQAAAQDLEAGGPGRWCITLGRGFDLPAAKRHRSSRAWPPEVKGSVLPPRARSQLA